MKFESLETHPVQRRQQARLAVPANIRPRFPGRKGLRLRFPRRKGQLQLIRRTRLRHGGWKRNQNQKPDPRSDHHLLRQHRIRRLHHRSLPRRQRRAWQSNGCLNHHRSISSRCLRCRRCRKDSHRQRRQRHRHATRPIHQRSGPRWHRRLQLSQKHRSMLRKLLRPRLMRLHQCSR